MTNSAVSAFYLRLYCLLWKSISSEQLWTILMSDKTHAKKKKEETQAENIIAR